MHKPHPLFIGLTVALYVAPAFATTQATNATACAGTALTQVDPTYGIRNTDASSNQTVWCPLIQNRPNGAAPFLGLSVYVYDRHNSSQVLCTLYVTNRAGAVRYSSTQITNGSGATAKAFKWSPNISVAVDDTANLKCILPPKDINGMSSIATYTVSEGI